MAKSGIYLNGKELLECELEKLSDVQRVEASLETHIKMERDTLTKISDILESKDNPRPSTKN